MTKEQTMNMSVKVLIGAQSAYACIKADHITMDVRLSPGRSAAQSLTESVAEMREKAAKLQKRADVIEAAAKLLQDKRMQVPLSNTTLPTQATKAVWEGWHAEERNHHCTGGAAQRWDVADHLAYLPGPGHRALTAGGPLDAPIN